MGQVHDYMSSQAGCATCEKGAARCGEVGIWECTDHEAPMSMVQMHGCTVEPPDFTDPQDLVCCRVQDDDPDVNHNQLIETLSYMPVRFQTESTVDVERSQARYSKIVVHSSRARTQRRSKAWEDWLRSATVGRSVVLVTGVGFYTPRAGTKKDNLLVGEDMADCEKVAGSYYLDRGLTKLSIIPAADGTEPVEILVDNIQVVCPLTDFIMLAESMEAGLDESERSRAALVQYLSEDNVSKRVCFLEESENAKDRCIQALTALWLEKRNDHSMWF